MSSNRKKPLLKCTFAHRLRGRVRILCRALRYLIEEREDLEGHFRDLGGVLTARIDCLASSAILTYQPELTGDEEILEAVESIISLHSLNALRRAREEENSLRVRERDLGEESLKTMLVRSACSGAMLAVHAATKPIVPATRLARLLSPTSLGILALTWPIFRSGAGALRDSLLPNADTLSALSVLASILSGQTVSALTVLLLHDLAESLTVYTMDRTRNAIRAMLSVENETAWRAIDGDSSNLEEVPVDELTPGDLIVVHTGEKICADGLVVEGRALVNQSSITGEFEPVVRETGGKVFAGTTVADGNATVRVETVGDQTAVSRIIRMVEEAEGKKASVQTTADRFSAALVPVNILLSLVVWMATRDAARALNMLIIDYSCGLRLSTAAALSAAITTAAKGGVLMKGGACIEALAESDTLVLDKTGTLTEGKPRVETVVPAKGVSKEELMSLAAAAEETSKHPMAVAVRSLLGKIGGKPPAHGKVETIVGRGVSTTVGRNVVRVGSKKFLNENGIHTHPMRQEASRLFASGQNVIFVAKNKSLAGLIGIRDPLRENMRKALNRLRYAGVDDIVLLTGDLEQQADVVAQRLGLDGFESELLPEDKARVVLRMQANGNRVVMVGDGINDAPGLAYADVGIALGKTRTDVAMEAADVTIAGDNALLLPGLYGLAHHTMDVIRQNFAVSVGLNSLGLLLGSTGLLPVVAGAVLHNAGTILVVANSLRVLLYDLQNPLKHA